MTTYQDIANQIDNRTDLTPTSYITAAEKLDAINASSAALHGIIAENWGEDYLLSEAFISGASATETLTLPTDFYKLVALDWKYGDGYVPLKRWDVSERYCNSASNIPASTYRLWYVPKYVNATSLSQTYPDALQLQGWHEWVILDVCIKAHVKQESDWTPYANQKAEVERRIVKQSSNRDASEPYTLLDERDSFGDPWLCQVPRARDANAPVKYRLHGSTIRLLSSNYWGWP